MAAAQGDDERTMEEILASIRRIIQTDIVDAAHNEGALDEEARLEAPTPKLGPALEKDRGPQPKNALEQPPERTEAPKKPARPRVRAARTSPVFPRERQSSIESGTFETPVFRPPQPAQPADELENITAEILQEIEATDKVSGPGDYLRSGEALEWEDQLNKIVSLTSDWADEVDQDLEAGGLSFHDQIDALVRDAAARPVEAGPQLLDRPEPPMAEPPQERAPKPSTTESAAPLAQQASEQLKNAKSKEAPPPTEPPSNSASEEAAASQAGPSKQEHSQAEPVEAAAQQAKTPPEEEPEKLKQEDRPLAKGLTNTAAPEAESKAKAEEPTLGTPPQAPTQDQQPIEKAPESQTSAKAETPAQTESETPQAAATDIAPADAEGDQAEAEAAKAEAEAAENAPPKAEIADAATTSAKAEASVSKAPGKSKKSRKKRKGRKQQPIDKIASMIKAEAARRASTSFERRPKAEPAQVIKDMLGMEAAPKRDDRLAELAARGAAAAEHNPALEGLDDILLEDASAAAQELDLETQQSSPDPEAPADDFALHIPASQIGKFAAEFDDEWAAAIGREMMAEDQDPNAHLLERVSRIAAEAALATFATHESDAAKEVFEKVKAAKISEPEDIDAMAREVILPKVMLALENGLTDVVEKMVRDEIDKQREGGKKDPKAAD